MNFAEAQDFLKEAQLRGSVLGLERVTELLRRMGEPQNKVKIIHISGTNGKGSFGAMMSSVLCRAGYKTGGFSSPAITDVTDSYRINGMEISREKFSDIIGYIASVCDGMDEKPTEFEILAAAAFELFYREKCDIALVECGMGGDTDATNVMSSPLLSVITNVQSDHCGFLGNTITEIAQHKAGIIKKERPVLFGGSNDDALKVVTAKAGEMNSPVTLACHDKISDINYTINGTDFVFGGKKYHIPLLGAYQPVNAVNVLCCIELLKRERLKISDEAVESGLASAKWHGRFEILSREPLVIFDGAHNPDGIRFASESIGRYFSGQKIAMLIGVMADKEYGLYADILGKHIEKVFAVKPDNPRALDSRILAEVFNDKNIPAESFEVLSDGVKKAFDYAKERNIPLIALGSLYMYKEFTAAAE